MLLKNSNPFLRHAEIQHLILEGTDSRIAYDHRLIYILENNGKITVGKITYNLSANSLVLLRPEVPYHCTGNMRGVVLNFDLTANHSEEIIPRCPTNAVNFNKNALFDRTSVAELEKPYIGAGNSKIRELLMRIADVFNVGNEYCDMMCSALLKELLCTVFLNYESGKDICSRVKAYIHNNVATVKDNSDVAKAFGYSTVYLAELFSKNTGTTLHSEIIKEKMVSACRWLENTNIPITEIYENCGFCSRTHFCTIFKKIYKITPSQYRKNALK